ncbi:hypothetical protein F5B21DRAFT_528284 [Xylaria acuta]|nr:hypothetical protein F5B21DRAFT_528284 [Xylaria acuta]
MESFCLGRGRVVDDTVHEKREGYLKYLTLLARDRPNHWVCEVFEDLLPVDQYDVPNGRFDLPYSLGKHEWNSRAYGPGSKCRLDERHIGIDHRHVHLTLKCARTQKICYWAYLKALLKPHHVEYSPYCEYGAPLSKIKSWGTCIKRFRVEYSAFPKIVIGINDDASQGDEGEFHFLLMSRWVYHLNKPPYAKRKGKGESLGFDKEKGLLYKKKPSESRQAVIGHLRICPHIQTCHPNCPDHGSVDGRCNVLGSALDTVLAKIIDSPDTGSVRQRGACKRCPTDFEVCAFSSSLSLSASIRIEIRVWQDMGTEKTSPACPAWKAHVRSLSARDPNFDNYGPVVYHRPGSIQKLYSQKQDESLANFLGGTHIMRRLRWYLGRHARVERLLRKVSARYGKF